MMAVLTMAKNLNKLFKIALTDTIEFKVKSLADHKVFIVTITPTLEPVPKSYLSVEKKKAQRRKPVGVVIMDCKSCHGVLVNGLCMDKKCETNK